MLDRIRSLLREAANGSFDDPHRPDALQVAVAGLLVEVARMHEDFDPAERATIRRLLAKRFDLTDDNVDALIETADRRVQEAGDFWTFARVVKDRFDEAQRIAMIEMMWEVAYADGQVDDFEASLMRRVAGLIYVDDFSSGAARKRVLKRLGIDEAN
ncbi:MAG: TerB family tellurite resistance protein [Candidatus Eiseniibacteriota bacterium]